MTKATHLRPFALLLAATAALATGCEKRAQMSISCQVTSAAGLDCRIQNNGPDAGSVCFDAAVKCSMGDKVAKICTERIDAKNADRQKVAALQPPIGLRETCYTAEIRNAKVRPE